MIDRQRRAKALGRNYLIVAAGLTVLGTIAWAVGFIATVILGVLKVSGEGNYTWMQVFVPLLVALGVWLLAVIAQAVAVYKVAR